MEDKEKKINKINEADIKDRTIELDLEKINVIQIISIGEVES